MESCNELLRFDWTVAIYFNEGVSGVQCITSKFAISEGVVRSTAPVVTKYMMDDTLIH